MSFLGIPSGVMKSQPVAGHVIGAGGAGGAASTMVSLPLVALRSRLGSRLLSWEMTSP